MWMKRTKQQWKERGHPTSSSCESDSQTQHMIKKLGLVLHCLVSPPSGSWSTSLDVCGFAQDKRTCLAPSARGVPKEAEKMCLERDTHTARRAVVQCQPLEDLQLPSIIVMDVLFKNCGFGDS